MLRTRPDPRPSPAPGPRGRRGAVLLVVLVLLALFAVIGLSFVLYAESEASAARISRETINRTGDPLPDANAAINVALGQMIYGVNEADAQAVQSGLRGYAFAQTMYPYSYFGTFPVQTRANTYSATNSSNLSPFSGLGLIASGSSVDGLTLPAPVGNYSRALVVNYAYQPGSGYIIDPEYEWFRKGASGPAATVDTTYPGATGPTPYALKYQSLAGAYTYPDHKDYYLSVFDYTDTLPTSATNPNSTYANTTGRVIQPSYYRTYGPFNPNTTSRTGLEWQATANGNVNWVSAQHRLAILRPRPADQLSAAELTAIGYSNGLPTNPSATDLTKINTAITTLQSQTGGVFPYPATNPDGSVTGDVQNLPNAQGMQHNDAIWIYTGGAVQSWRGKQYVAMVAPTVIDLSGRVNLSVAGNLLGSGTTPANMNNHWLRSLFGIATNTPTPTSGLKKTHGSYAGVGPFEVNPLYVLAMTPEPTTGHPNPGDVNRDQRALLRLLGGGLAFDGGTAVNGRYGSGTVNHSTDPGLNVPKSDLLTGSAQIAYNGGSVPPHYSRVDLNASGNGSSDRAAPVGSGSSPFPQYTQYTNRYFANTTAMTTQLSNHPGQMNPDFWPSSGSSGRVFAASDMKRLGEVNRAGDKPADPSNGYAGYFYQTDTAKLAPWQMVSANYFSVSDGNANANGVHNPLTFNPNNPSVTGTYHRGNNMNNSVGNPFATTTDPALLTRMLTTTFSTSLSRPEVTLNGQTTGTGANKSTPLYRLGPVDVARPLPDYRSNTNAALSPTNIWPSGVQPTPPATAVTAADYQKYQNYALARRSRQNLARDVFIRLVGSYVAYQKANGVTSTLVDGSTVWYVPSTGYLGFGNGTNNTTTPTTQQMNFLRSLAQIAANVVDYVDSDDINTAFVWNPSNAQALDPLLSAAPPALVAGASPPIDTGFIDPSSDGANFTAAQLGNRVVYGTELPRLVINEAYAMLGNDISDLPPTGNQQRAQQHLAMSFWVELHNPLAAVDTSAKKMGNDSSLSDGGAARLQYVSGTSQNATSSYPVYDIVIADNGRNAAQKLHFSNQLLATPGNVTGDPTPAYGTNGTLVRLTINNYTQDTTNPATTLTNDDINLIQPAGGNTSGTPGGNNGYFVVGPPVQKTTPPNTTAKNQFPGGDVNCSLRLPYPATSGTSSMVYDAGVPSQGNMNNRANHTHTVILRRLANPYLPPDATANPYITTDYLESIPTRNQVFFTSQGPVAGQQYSAGAARANSLPSVGRRHPYTALASGTGTSPTAYSDTLTSQFVLPQVAQTGMSPQPTNPAHSFFYANTPTSPGTADTGSNPKWLVHLDRQPLNALELVHVSAVPPAMLTQNFGAWPTGTPPSYPSDGFANSTMPKATQFQGLGYQWYNAHSIEGLLTPGFFMTANGSTSRVTNGLRTITDPAGTQRTLTPLDPPNTATNTPAKLPAPNTEIEEGFLSMALGMLTTRPIYGGSPVGGRESGRLNLNTIPRVEVAQSLFDQNDGHFFTAANVTSPNAMGNADGFWDRMNPSATVNPPTQPHAYTGSKIRNFAITASSGTNPNPQIWATGSANATIHQTVFRNGGVNDNSTKYGNPLFFNTTAASSGLTNDPEHAQGVMEPLRKVWNSSTATSNSFLVVMTVGFFEVRGYDNKTGRPLFGQEMYKDVPGDLRQKFASVVDRTNLGIDTTTTAYQAAEKPWFTSLAEDVMPGATTIKVRAATNNATNSNTTPTDAYVYTDGIQQSLLNRQIVLGFGDGTATTGNGGDGEQVTTGTPPTKPTPPATIPAGSQAATWSNGVATVTLKTAVQRYHPSGTPVSNVLLGHPGPQPLFDYSAPRYQGVVPYTSRLTVPPTQ